MVTYDEGDYEGGQEDGRPHGHGSMKYSESDPLGRLVIQMLLRRGLTMWLFSDLAMKATGKRVNRVVKVA